MMKIPKPKVAKKKLAREIIDRYRVGEQFTDEDRELFSRLCGYCFTRIIREVPKDEWSSSQRCISVTCPEECHTGRWSWIKSIDGYEHRKNLLEALRAASRQGTAVEVELTVCAACGSTEHLGVDHKTTPFSSIVSQYLSECSEPLIENQNGGWVIAEDAERRRFIEFHDAVADYQVLCRSCNAKKGSG
jgi:hypothetical protein